MVCTGTTLPYNLTYEQFRCKCPAVALLFHIVHSIVKACIMSWFGKAIPLQAWTGPEGSRRLRLPDFKTIGT
jgi:hypothetical protein